MRKCAFTAKNLAAGLTFLRSRQTDDEGFSRRSADEHLCPVVTLGDIAHTDLRI